MDPITQGLLGGVAAQAASRKKNLRVATLVGAIAGILPDLDVLIRSKTDPLLSLEYHRHFTHALIFIPVGGLLTGLILWLLLKRRYSFGVIFWAALVGWATHGLLDAFTSYGTLLWWPFNRERVAWDTVHVLHPLITFLLAVGLAGAYRLIKRWPAGLALVAMGFILAGGYWQQSRALQAQRDLAASRGQIRERGRVFPTLGNWTLWRSVYQSGGKFYVDAIRVVPFRPAQYWPGGSIEKFVEPPQYRQVRDLHRDLGRYLWFTNDYLARVPGEAVILGDMRFSLEPLQLMPLWGIQIVGEDSKLEVQRVRFPVSVKREWGPFWEMLWGNYPGTRLVPPTSL